MIHENSLAQEPTNAGDKREKLIQLSLTRYILRPKVEFEVILAEEVGGDLDIAPAEQQQGSGRGA